MSLLQASRAPLRHMPRLLPTTTISISSSSSATTTTRALSTTPSLQRQTPTHHTVPAESVPDYPYGRFHTYKQRNEGLYGRGKIRFGNVVAHKYGNKSRTSWLPNRHTKRFWSPALNGFIRTRVTARVLHTIDLLGGIDEYLLGSKTRRIKELGPAGWALRWKIMQTPVVRARFAKERAALGLPPKNADAEGEDDAAAAAAVAFPAELAAQGLEPAAVLSQVDAMLERDDEFVIGEPAAEAEDVVAVGESQDAPEQVRKPEQADHGGDIRRG